MTYNDIIIGIGVLIGLLLIGRTRPNLLKGILLGLIIGFILTFANQQILITISNYSIIVLTLIFSIYSAINKKWSNFIIGTFALASFIFILNHYPYSNVLKLLMIIPILTYLMTFKKPKKYKNEISILTILVAYELTEFLQLMEQWLK